MKMFGRKMTLTGDQKNRKKLMKILDKFKADCTSVRTIKVEDSDDRFEIVCYVKDKKVGKICHKIDGLVDYTIG